MRKATKIFIIFGLLFIIFISGRNDVSADTSIYTVDGEPIYDNIIDAGTYLRSQMKKRETTVIVNYLYDNYTNSASSTIYEEAVKHTGVGNEGDYISANLNSKLSGINMLNDGINEYVEIKYTFDWLVTKEMEDEVDIEISKVLEELDVDGLTEYEKIKKIYDYVCDNVHYDHEYYERHKLGEYEKIPHSTYAAIIKKNAVCQGFATLLYRLLVSSGVDCRYISGYSGDEHHAWNIVRIDGLYYNVDSTWDRGLSVYYRYFLCTEHNFGDHTRNSIYNTSEFNEEYPMAQVPYGVSAQASGTLNSKMSWYLEKNGVLTISGTGAMPNFNNIGAPWYQYRTSIKKVVVEEGITSIGSYAFTRCNIMTEVSLPSTLLMINTYAFDNCRSLSSIDLPNKLWKIETNAFSECVALTRIELPDSVTTVGSSVFSTCHNLKYVKLSAGMKEIPDSMFFNMDTLNTVIIPEGITSIGDTVFRGGDGITEITIPAQISKIGVAAFADCTKLKNIYVDSDNQYFTSVNGILFSKDMKTLICYPAGRTATTYTVPSGVTKIGYAAFGTAKKLYYIYLPDSVTHIDTYAFTFCDLLQKMTIGPNVVSLGDAALGYNMNLKSVVFENPNTTLDWHTFSNCVSLTSVTLPQNLTRLPTGLFSGCSKLKEITIPETVTVFGDSCFNSCSSLKIIDVPKNVTFIGYDAFYKCTSLEIINIHGNISTVDFRAFQDCTSLKIINLSGTLGTIDTTAFKNTVLKSAYFENATTVNKITSKSVFNGWLTNNRSIGISTSIKNIPSFITNNYKYVQFIEYDDKFYNLYADHQCEWVYYAEISTSSSTGYRCNTCNAIKETHYHVYKTTTIEPTCTDAGYKLYKCDCGNSYTSNYVSALGHSYGQWNEITPSTCKEMGLAERICSRCGIYEYMDLPLSDHDEIVLEKVDPTCEKQGYTTYICSFCGNKVDKDFEGSLGHNYGVPVYTWDESLEKVTAKRVCLNDESHFEEETVDTVYSVIEEAKCLENGNGLYTSNEFINSAFSVQTYEIIIEALGHDIISHEGKDPTCLDLGYKAYETCSRCDYSTYETIPAIGHNYGDVIYIWSDDLKTVTAKRVCLNDTKHIEEEIVDTIYRVMITPSCLEIGFGKYVTNKFANEAFKEQIKYVELSALGHDIIKHEKKEATCILEGHTEYEECSRCDYTTFEIIEALGHNYLDIEVKATCTEDGYTKHICSRCSDSFNDNYVDATGHDYGEITYIWSNTLNSVTAKRVCGNDENHMEEETVFTYYNVLSNPTCLKTGSGIYRTNDFKNEAFETQTKIIIIPALGHETISHEGKEPTCTEVGWKEYETCSRCDYSTYEEIKAKGHNYKTVIIEPTCLDNGYTIYTCSICSDTYTDNYINPTGHNYGEITYTWTDTLNSVTAKRICLYDESHVEEETVTTIYSIATNPTCLTPGISLYTTNVFNNKAFEVQSKTVIIASLGHDLTSHEGKEATCTEAGWQEYETCLRCDYSTYETIEAMGHNYGKWIANNDGTHYRVCGNDDSHIENKNCEYGEWVIINEAGPFTEGLRKRICGKCNYEETEVIASTHVHEFNNEYTIDKEATCTEDGLKSKHCLKDNCISVIEETIIPKTGHNYSEVSYTWSINYNTVTAKRECQNDKNHIEEETVTTNYSIVITPRCEENGLGRYTSRNFQNKDFSIQIKEVEINALGHDIVTHISKDPTCTESGWKEYDTCTRCDYSTYEKIEELGHTYISEVIKPTCTTEGYTKYICDRCNDTYIDSYTNPTGHNYNEPSYIWSNTYNTVTAKRICLYDESHIEEETVKTAYSIIKNPSCNEKGIGLYTSNVFINKAFKIQSYEIEIDALGHDLTSHEGKEATCLESGYKEYETCSRCDYTTYEALDALGHNLTSHEGKEATCLESGYKEYETCSRCDYTTYEAIEALGHDLTSHEGKEATCLESGYKEYETCSRCDYTTYEAIDALGHDLTNHEGKEATCLDSGYKAYEYCSRCDYTTYEELDALGHDLTSHEGKAATCLDSGYKAYETCSRCDYTTYEAIEALGHNLTSHEGKAATCLESGYKAYEDCSRCDYTTYEELEALGHDLTSHEGKEATCLDSGYKAYETCSRCEYTTYEELEALGHNYYDPVYKWSENFDTVTAKRVCGNDETHIEEEAVQTIYNIENAPTCLENGLGIYTSNEFLNTAFKVQKCEVDIPAKGHDYASTIIAPTCEEKGYTIHICGNCNDRYDDTYENPIGHQYNEPLYTWGENYTTLSGKVVCMNDSDHIIKETVSVTYSIISSPSCEENGLLEYESNDFENKAFSKQKYQIKIDALGHDLVIHKEKEPTCLETGHIEYEACKRCSYTTYEALEALGHKYITEDVLPSCVDKGYKKHECDRCHDLYYDSYVDPLGHTESEWIIDEEPTTKADGHKYKECIICHKVLEEEVISKLPEEKSPVVIIIVITLAVSVPTSLGIVIIYIKKKRR